MRRITHPPDAAAVVGSLRAIGYSMETALADIIDNSVAKDALSVSIRVAGGVDPYVTIADDGCGMDRDALMLAMRHGGKGPQRDRVVEDLGRYGLGLKTASLSQCRQLTVASLERGGQLVAAQWDIDTIIASNDWTLQELEPEEIAGLPQIERLADMTHGTLVVWRKFDRLALSDATAGNSAAAAAVDASRDYLALIFHRFIMPEDNRAKVSISINGVGLEAIDPFLLGNKNTLVLPSETVSIGDSVVTMQPYILPHPNHLSAAELASVGGIDGLRQSQGFYVYRNRRLIVWGTWFRLIRQDQLSKLARVRVDIPNTLSLSA